MGTLDDHNKQHTYGNSLGPPTSVVGVSAQQAVDAHKRLAEGGVTGSTPSAELSGKDGLRLALVCGVFVVIAVLIAYAVGGIVALVAGLLAVIAGIIGIVFLISALVAGAKSGVAVLLKGRRRGPSD